MKAIVAVDLNWGIGYQGHLLQPIPEDLKLFKRMTLGKVVIMGRGTFESLPAGKPLPDRTNIVLTSDKSFAHEDVTVCNSLAELHQVIGSCPEEDLCVIGGESVYSQLLPLCTEALVTKIGKEYTADKYFSNLDELDTWELSAVSDLKVYQDIPYRFVRYVNNNKNECLKADRN